MCRWEVVQSWGRTAVAVYQVQYAKSFSAIQITAQNVKWGRETVTQNFVPILSFGEIVEDVERLLL